MAQYREHRFRSSCGRLELFARDYPGDKPGAPALLLMHGLTRNSADFEPMAAWLAGAYRLIVPDTRGRGLSDYDPDPANYRPDVYAADMFALLDDLDIVQAGLIGTSMGGLIAMTMASFAATSGRGDRIGPIVINDIGPVIEVEGLARIADYAGDTPVFPDWAAAAAACAKNNRSAFPGFEEDDWMAFARRTCHETERGVVFAYDPAIAAPMTAESAQAAAAADLWPVWPALDGHPLLVVRGTLTDLLSAETVTEMGRRHVGPFAHVEVPGRGHAPLLNEPEVRKAVGAFLAEHYPA